MAAAIACLFARFDPNFRLVRAYVFPVWNSLIFWEMVFWTSFFDFFLALMSGISFRSSVPRPNVCDRGSGRINYCFRLTSQKA